MFNFVAVLLNALFSTFFKKQVRKIVKNYVEYYNHLRLHQGINKISDGEMNSTTGIIKQEQILGGLNHHYYRSST